MATDQTQVKNNVYKAIDVIAKQRIDSLKLDKTIIGTVEAKVSNQDNQYRITYNGGSLYAYAQKDEVYLPNIAVYILVPEGNFSKKKWIIGRVSSTQVDENIDTVASAINNYNVVGTNTVFVKNENLKNAFKLESYKEKENNATFQNANVLYDSKRPEISVLDINTEDLIVYVRQSRALSLAANFRTSLSKEQQRMVAGDYGLIFNLRFQNKNTSYATMKDKWDSLEPNTLKEVENPQHEKVVWRLNYYEQQIKEKLLLDNTVQEIQNQIYIIYTNMNNYIEQIKASLDNETKVLIEQYSQLITDIIALTVDIKGNPISNENLIAEYNNWFSGDSDSYVETIESYYLDVNEMVGNPYNLSSYAHQYIIIPIDTEKFIGVDSIYFFCDGFIQSNNKADMWGYDLFVKDIEINCLEELDDENSDYRLTLEYPQGTIFRTNDLTDKRTVKAKLIYQNQEDLTSFSSFAWFKKDSSVKSDSPSYTALAGAGWRRVSTDSFSEQNFAASDNKSYENCYKVIVTYNMEIFLSKEFILYNEANHHEIKIVSDTGFSFEMSEEDKRLICLIDNEDVTENYYFYWYINEELLDRTAEEYKELIEQEEEFDLNVESLQKISFYKNKFKQLDGIHWDKNVLTFPSKQVPSKSDVIITCIVSKDTYDVGQDTVKLSQGELISLKGYHIVIENGNQVFQYNEAGVSPASSRYEDPMQILPLSCKFYSPGGGLINKLNYTVKWQVPLTNSLILVDETRLLNEGIDPNAVCNFTIADDYNYASINNQITCIVEFNGDTYTETTDFFFGKIGENGTNGTDVVAKIVPIEEKTNSVLNTELLALIVREEMAKWNTGAAINTPVLELQLYRRNDYIDPEQYQSVKWNMAGNTRALHMSTYASSSSIHGEIGTVDYSIEELPKTVGYEYLTNQIVKGQASLRLEDGGYQAYNYFYPIPTILWQDNVTPYPIGIDKNLTMRQILYNADGRNPAYNKNQGVKIIFSEDRKIIWGVIGGKEDNALTAALKLQETEDNSFVYVLPVDVYSGEYTNNCVIACIHQYTPAVIEIDEDGNEQVVSEEILGQLEATVIVPIHMSLNTYGLASLNSWDGNSIEIDEEAGYILAPQIGAGEKHVEDNTFTGVVMGVEQTYEDAEFGKEKKKNVGLLGYSHGKQSIFLNAEDGSATFGLPEDEAQTNDPYTEGRIRLKPGGESNIGNWRIGSRSLYNIVGGDITSPYSDEYAIGHKRDIHHENQGILLSADPAYISIKGRILEEPDINMASANRVIKPGDALEIQLDPSQRSLISIFRHYKDENGDWKRRATVGIDRQGRFYSNALRQESTSLAIGFVGAFNKTAADEEYIGTSVDVGSYTVWKLFTKYNNGVSENSTMYLSGATHESDDYFRPIQIMGNNLDLRTHSNSDRSRIHLDTSSIFLGQKNANIEFNTTTGKLKTSSNFVKETGGSNTETIGNGSTINITGALTQTITGNTNITTANSEVRDSENQFRLYGKTENSITPYDFRLSRNGSNNNSYLSINNHRFVLQTNSSQGSGDNTGGSINIEALKTNFGLTLRTTPIDGSTDGYNAGLRVVPSRGGHSFFNLYAEGFGQVWTTFCDVGEVRNQKCVQVTPTLTTKGIYIDDEQIEFVGGHCSFYSAGALQVNSRIAAKGDIDSSEGSISCSGDMTSRNGDAHVLMIDANCIVGDDGRTEFRSNTSVRAHIYSLYQLVNDARARANAAYSKAETADANANSRVLQSTYDNHTHSLDVTGYSNIALSSDAEKVTGTVSYSYMLGLTQSTGIPE